MKVPGTLYLEMIYGAKFEGKLIFPKCTGPLLQTLPLVRDISTKADILPEKVVQFFICNKLIINKLIPQSFMVVSN